MMILANVKGIIALVLLLSVWACTPAGNAFERGGSPSSPVPPQAETPTATLGGVTSSPAEARVVERAIALLADHLEVSKGQIELVALQPPDWQIASLGCAWEEADSQATRSGIELILSYQSQFYRLHSGTRDLLILCGESGSSEGNPPKIDGTIRDGHPNQPIEGGIIISTPSGMK